MNIRTSQDANAVSCCPCAKKTCEAPRKICESVSYTASCADDDYTDAHDEWLRVKAKHDEWEDAHEDFPILHAAWVTAHSDWEACEISTPGECGPEPIEPVDPPEPDTEGAEPEPPEGYSAVDHGCFGPFIQPAGDLTDDLPTIYRTLQEKLGYRWSGYSWAYYSGAGTPPLSSEVKATGNYTLWQSSGAPHIAGDVADYTETQSGNIHDGGDDSCTPFGPEAITLTNFKLPDDSAISYTLDSTTPTATATVNSISHTYTAASGVEPELQGCDGAFPETSTESWDLTREDVAGQELGSGITRSDLGARAVDNLPDDFPDPSEGSDCVASLTIDWPTIGDLTPWPEVVAGDVESYDHGSEPPNTTAEATATKVQYQYGIPESWADFDGRHATWVTDYADWVIAYAAWEADDPETRGDAPVEPLEPTERTVYELQWDVGFFSREWTEWKSLKDDFELASLLHDEWADCEDLTPGDCGAEPDVPEDPGAEPTRPNKISSESWSYNGVDEFSEKFVNDAPTTEGEVRNVNMLVICYHDTRLGVKPTSHGEVFEFDE